MAFSFPLDWPTFLSRLPVREMTFDLSDAMEISGETGGGELLTAELGTRLWQGDIRLGEMTRDETDDVLPLLDILRRPGASFLVHDLRRPWPRNDPRAIEVGSATPSLSDIRANRREIRIAELPAGYELARGDYLAFTYGSDPDRLAVHRIARGDAADGTGQTGYIEVSPNIRPGATVGTPVRFWRPSCKAIIVPKSFEPGRTSHTITSGVGFRFQQTLR